MPGHIYYPYYTGMSEIIHYNNIDASEQCFNLLEYQPKVLLHVLSD